MHSLNKKRVVLFNFKSLSIFFIGYISVKGFHKNMRKFLYVYMYVCVYDEKIFYMKLFFIFLLSVEASNPDKVKIELIKDPVRYNSKLSLF